LANASGPRPKKTTFQLNDIASVGDIPRKFEVAELAKSLVVVLNSRPKSGEFGYIFESYLVIALVIASSADFAILLNGPQDGWRRYRAMCYNEEWFLPFDLSCGLVRKKESTSMSTDRRVTAVALIMLLAVIATTPIVVADEPSQETIAKWVKQLDAQGFIAREQAMRDLTEAGLPAIEILAKELPTGNLEVALRGVHVLQQLSLSSESEIADPAWDALHALQDGPPCAASRQASDVLSTLYQQRQDVAIRDLESAGAKVQYITQSVNGQLQRRIYSVEINNNWLGDDSDLKQLRWLGDVPRLTLEGEKLTDASMSSIGGMKGLVALQVKRTNITEKSLANLGELKQLNELSIWYSPLGDGAVAELKKLENATEIKLFGTKMTRRAADELQAAMPAVKIDFRQGAFLGVGCAAHEKGCEITIVHPGSAAQKADIRTGDVITLYQGDPVKDFENLTQLIAKNRSRDKVALKILRGEEVLDIEVELGEWE